MKPRTLRSYSKIRIIKLERDNYLKFEKYLRSRYFIIICNTIILDIVFHHKHQNTWHYKILRSDIKLVAKAIIIDRFRV